MSTYTAIAARLCLLTFMTCLRLTVAAQLRAAENRTDGGTLPAIATCAPSSVGTTMQSRITAKLSAIWAWGHRFIWRLQEPASYLGPPLLVTNVPSTDRVNRIHSSATRTPVSGPKPELMAPQFKTCPVPTLNSMSSPVSGDVVMSPTKVIVSEKESKGVEAPARRQQSTIPGSLWLCDNSSCVDPS